MGGRDAMRGFMIQTLVAVLDALHDANASWIAVTIEPDSANDKVDLLWEMPGRLRAQQVKSSQNQISKAMAQAWSADLQASKAADEYELVLAGPVAQAVIDDAPFGSVAVPRPLALDTIALLERAVTRLDRYLSAKAMPTVPLEIRETLAILVSAKLNEGAVTGHRLERHEFDGWIMRWIAAAYPEAIRTRLSANCEILWSRIVLRAAPTAADQAFRVVLPLTVVNGGPAVAVVQRLVLKISCAAREMRYEPDGAAEGPVGAVEESFGAFAILPNAYRELRVAFRPCSGPGYAVDMWPIAEHRFSLYVYYASSDGPRLAGVGSAPVTLDHRAAMYGEDRSILLGPVGMA